MAVSYTHLDVYKRQVLMNFQDKSKFTKSPHYPNTISSSTALTVLYTPMKSYYITQFSLPVCTQIMNGDVTCLVNHDRKYLQLLISFTTDKGHFIPIFEFLLWKINLQPKHAFHSLSFGMWTFLISSNC